MAGRIQSGPTTEEQVRLKEADMSAERQHVVEVEEAIEARRDQAIAAATANRSATEASTRPGILQRIRRLLQLR